MNRILQKCLRIACKTCRILEKKTFLKQKFESPKFVLYASQWCGIDSKVVLGSQNFNFNHRWHIEAFLEIFQKVTIGHRYHFFALHAIWSCFGAWKTTFWAWSFEFCKPQYWSYNQNLEAGTSMSPYLKSLGPDFWYYHYFLKKIEFFDFISSESFKTCDICMFCKQFF